MTERGGNLHQLLAVKKDVATRANEITGETKKVLDKKHLFYGSLKTYEPFEESTDFTEEPQEGEHLGYTVGEKIDWFTKELGRLIDIEFQIDVSNQQAVADINIDGLLLASLPATFLLDLIGLLERVRNIYQHIQILDPKYEWIPAPEYGDGVFRSAGDDVTHRTKKQTKHKVLYDATKEHPAQIEKWFEDERIGKYTKRHWSGCLTAHQKALLLGRLDELIQATKKALSFANEREHAKTKIAGKIFSWLHKDIPLGGVARDGAQFQAESDSES